MSNNNNNDDNNNNNKDKIEYWDNILKRADESKGCRHTINSIATETGIAITSHTQNHEIVEKIKRVVKRNRDMIEQKELLSKLNPFNTVSQLANKDIEQYERSFWKVFKSKTIFKHIMSNMNQIPYLSRSYDSIVSVENMVKSNQFYMLKDKVKRVKHLHFKQYDYSIFNGIFNGIKDDLEFYKSLFKNYSDQISLIVFYKNDLIKEMIKSKCIIVIKEFINHFQLKPDVDIFLYAIKCGSIKVIEYFLNGDFNFINENPDIPFKSSSVTVADPNYSLISIIKNKLHLPQRPKVPDANTIKYQISKNEINNFIVSSLNSFIKPFKTLYYLIEIKKLVLLNDQIKSSLNSTFNNNPLESTLKDLVFSYKLQHLQTNQQPQQPAALLLVSSKLYSSFSKQQLKSKLNDPINFNSDKVKTIVKLLDYYFSYAIQARKCIEYYHYYQKGQTHLYDPMLGKITESDAIFALNCGHFDLFSIYIDQNTGPNIKTLIGKSKLFSKCIENKEKKESFLKSFINGIKLDFNKHQSSLLDYLCMLVELDDLELVKYFTNEIGKDNILAYSPPFSNVDKIKSTGMLDYLFTEFQRLRRIIKWHQFNDFEALKHYEKLVQLKLPASDQNEIDFFFKRIDYNSTITDKAIFEQLSAIANHIVNSPQIYTFTEGHIQIIIEQIHKTGTIDESLIMNIVKSTDLKMNIVRIFNGKSPKSFFNIFNWMQSNYKDEFEIGGRFHYEVKWTNVYFYIENGLLDTSVINLIIIYDHSFRFSTKIGKQGDINLLSKFISIDNRFLDGNIEFLSDLIYSAIANDQLDIIKWIHLKHKNVFLQKTITLSKGVLSFHGIFSLNDLRKFVKQSVASDNVLVTRFLMDSIYVTDKMFGNCSPNNYSNGYYLCY